MPLAGIGIALLAPLVGGLTNKLSLRLVMLVGSLMGAIGFALLATTSSPALFLLAYGALIGPGICLSAVLAPTILTTRWFEVGRGRALGIVNVPLMMALLPLIATYVLSDYGLDTVFWMLTGLMLLTFVAQLFVIDYPPQRSDQGSDDSPGPGDSGASAKQLLSSANYWKLVIALSLMFASIVMIGSHMMPMAIGWGITPTRAATLLTIYAGAAIIGTPLFGWLADRIGGRGVLIIIAGDLAILFGLLIFQPPFALFACVAGAMGLHIASVGTCFALIAAEQFGPASFGRAFGISQLINLPFSVGSVPLAAWIYERTGSYANALALHVAVLGLAVLLILMVRTSAVARTDQ